MWGAGLLGHCRQRQYNRDGRGNQERVDSHFVFSSNLSFVAWLRNVLLRFS
jgi:hypothetical protein